MSTKFALAYSRISTEDQSTYSISGQIESCHSYATRCGITILETFVDDGFSAKSFERPGWDKLLQYIKKHKGKVNAVLVHRYDRLIRNVVDGIQCIRELQKLGIQVMSVSEQIPSDMDNPASYQMLAYTLLFAECERLTIAQRTREGMNSARLSGRYMSRAPFGYVDHGSGKNRTLQIDQAKAEVIKQIFHSYASGVSKETILQVARKNGLTTQGRSVISKIVSNPVYAGMIRVPAYKSTPEKFVPGSHSAIIDQETFWRCQEILKASKRSHRTIISDKLPLRGLVSCTNGHILTGATSKGRHGHLIDYYKCNHCNGNNHNANRAHEELQNLLCDITFNDAELKALRTSVERQLKEATAMLAKDKIRLQKEIAELQSKLEALEEKYITDKINHESYSKWHSKWSFDIAELRAALHQSNTSFDEVWSIWRKQSQSLTQINNIYASAEPTDKQLLIQTLFPGGLIKLKKGYRTPFISPFFSHKAQQTDLLEIKKTSEALEVSLGSP